MLPCGNSTELTMELFLSSSFTSTGPGSFSAAVFLSRNENGSSRPARNSYGVKPPNRFDESLIPRDHFKVCRVPGQPTAVPVSEAPKTSSV
jgi:hypothetical protein